MKQGTVWVYLTGLRTELFPLVTVFQTVQTVNRDSNTDEGGTKASEIDLFCFVHVNEQ